MSNVLVQDSTLTAIADAIRAMSGSTDTMLPSEMADLISAISTGYEVEYGSKAVTSVASSMSLGLSKKITGDFIFIMMTKNWNGGGQYTKYYVKAYYKSVINDTTTEETFLYSTTSGSMNYVSMTNTGVITAASTSTSNTCSLYTGDSTYYRWVLVRLT